MSRAWVLGSKYLKGAAARKYGECFPGMLFLYLFIKKMAQQNSKQIPINLMKCCSLWNDKFLKPRYPVPLEY